MSNNLYLYWVGNEYKLIKILRNLIYLHSTNGNGYNVHLINKENIANYIKVLPDYFHDLCPAHQADYVRVNVICEYGGIWLDSDTLVMNSLDSLFNITKIKDGFFIKEGNTILWNGIFGSKPNTPLMVEWKTKMIEILNNKKQSISWAEIGNELLESIYITNPLYYNNYAIFNGLDNMYPVNWYECVQEYLHKPYENYKNIERKFQPLVVLVNSVYKELERLTENEILNGTMPINYFINKSLSIENNRKNIFNNIYKNCIWNNGDSSIPLSGPGSSIENTIEVASLLNSFIYENNIKTILDLGCGDLTWISKTQFFNDNTIKYTGIDIVENLINEHSLKYPNKKFYCKDIVNYNNIEYNSLIIIRDVIFHLKNEDVLQIFNNIKGKCDFIAITSCKNDVNYDNHNQNIWHFSEKNIHIEPFNIKEKYLKNAFEKKFNRNFYIYSHDSFLDLPLVIFETDNIPKHIKEKLSLKYIISHNINNSEYKIVDCKTPWGLQDKNTIQNIINSYQSYDSFKTIYIFLITDNCDKFLIPNNVKLYRTSLLKSIKSHNEYILPYIWEGIEQSFDPLIITEKPIIGFCGVNSHYRLKTIQLIEQDNRFVSNFIIRNQFWGGNPHNSVLVKNYEDNMQSSHFNICNRGAGNFSMRFYQTLSCGRIPVLLNTNMLLPFENEIDWNDIIVMANTEEELIDKILYCWNNKDIIKMQIKCKEIYDTYFAGTKFLDRILQ